jgi:hypothetical protein
VVFLHPDAGQAVASLRRQLREKREESERREQRAETLVTGAAERRRERGRPYYELEPPLRVLGQLCPWPDRRGRACC